MKRNGSVHFSKHTLPRVLFGLVALGLLFYAALTVWLAYSGIFFPYLLDYGEGNALWFSQQVAHGNAIYMPLGESFVTTNYPPVFFVLAASLNGVFGASYVWGRFLNFAALFLITAFIMRFVRSETRDWRATILAALFFFGSTFVYHWSPLFRIDFPAVAFTLAGIFCVWRWEKAFVRRQTSVSSFWARVANPQFAFAVVFFLLALYTKHSLVVAPAAAALAILLRDKRAGIAFALTLGAIGGAIFLALEIFTRGGWSFGLITANATVWSARIFLPLIQSFVLTYAILLALGGWGWVTRVRAKQIGVLEIYAAGTLLATALAGREGAWENYFFEVIAMACVFAGFTFARLLQTARVRWVLPALLLVQLILFWDHHDPRIAQDLMNQARLSNIQIAPLLMQAQGPVVSEDLGLLITNGRPVVYYSFPYSTLARAGKWDQHWEVENLRAGKFPLVILMQGTRVNVDNYLNFTRTFVSALDYGYALKWQDAYYQVYAPAPLKYFEPRAVFGDLFELVGWSVEPEELRAGQAMDVVLLWQAQNKPTARFTGFVHLEDAQGNVLAQDDHEPKQAAYPTPLWAQDEMVRDTFHLKIPDDLKPGEYVLRAGWYDSDSQDRLSTADGADFVELKKFTVP